MSNIDKNKMYIIIEDYISPNGYLLEAGTILRYMALQYVNLDTWKTTGEDETYFEDEAMRLLLHYDYIQEYEEYIIEREKMKEEYEEENLADERGEKAMERARDQEESN